MHENEGSWEARARLVELSVAEVDHWRLNPHHGGVMEPKEYVDWVRLRLGCAGPGEPVPCAACQSGSLDTGAAHATYCALGEATRGHNAVTALVHAAAQSWDCTAETEAPGLIPGTDLTSALGNTNTALEISISSPHAQQAGFLLHTDQGRGQTHPLRCAPPLSPPPEHFPHTDCLECFWATSPRHVDCFALSQ